MKLTIFFLSFLYHVFFLQYKTHILTVKHLDTTTKYKGRKKLILNSTTVNIAAFFSFLIFKGGFRTVSTAA